MTEPRLYRLAALLVIACALAMGLAFGSLDATLTLQPSIPDAHNADFSLSLRADPRGVLAFMALDLLFILGYLTVFIGFYVETRPHLPTLATVALVFGLGAGVFDLVENSYFVTYALQNLYGHPLADPALPLIYVLASMKWFSAFLALFLYALAWPKQWKFDWALATFMFLSPVLGAVTIALPELMVLRPMPLLGTMVMAALHFHKRAQ